MTIDVQLIVHADCKLTAIDDNSYLEIYGGASSLEDSLNNYISIEYLKYKDLDLIQDSIKIQSFKYLREHKLTDSVFYLPKDGVFCYYKFMIPKLEYLFIESENTGFYTGVYLKNQTYIYNNTVYKYTLDDIFFDEPKSYNEVKELISKILEKSTIINLEDLLDNIGSQTFYCKKTIFTICNLTKCFVSLHQNSKNFKQRCVNNTEDTSIKDFLLSTIHVLDYLADIKEFTEAQRILENVMECGQFCTDIETENNCGCNG